MDERNRKDAEALVEMFRGFSDADAIRPPHREVRQLDAALLVDLVDELRQRAEQAERGRDEWEQTALSRDLDVVRLTSRAERAEADNAREREAHTMTAAGWEAEAAKWRDERAALLERLRALEKAVDALTASDVSLPGHIEALVRDALKVTP